MKDIDQVLSLDNLRKAHVSMTTLLIKKLAQFRWVELAIIENEEEINAICARLAHTFSLESFAKAFEIVKARILQVKHSLNSSSSNHTKP